MKNKIAIISFDTRDSEQWLVDIKKISQEYCQLHNYDYIFDHFKIDDVKLDINDFILDEKNIFSLKLFYHRYELFEKYINDYDYIVSFDSDICISNPLIKIEDLIDDEHDIFIAQDGTLFATTVWLYYAVEEIKKYLIENKLGYLKNPEQELSKLKIFDDVPVYEALSRTVTNINGLNCGFIIIKCTDLIKELINDFKKYYLLFEQSTFCQGCLPTLLRRKKYKNSFKLLPLGTMGLPNYGHPDFSYNENVNFICHPAGTKNKESILNIIEKIKENKWWKIAKEQ